MSVRTAWLLAVLVAAPAVAEGPTLAQGGPLPRSVLDCEVPMARSLAARTGAVKATATSTLSPASTRYVAGNAVDGDPATAWVEGEDGDGLGTRLVLTSSDGSPLPWPSAGFALTMGYAKSDVTWTENGRPTKVRLTARHADPEFADSPKTFDLVASEGVAARAPTFFTLGCVCNQDMSCSEGFSSFEFEILAIDAGTKYRDTAISDVILYDVGD